MTNSTVDISNTKLNDTSADHGIRVATAGDYFALLKPGVMKLVVFTGLVGLVAAPGEINLLIAFAAILAIAVGAGASAALNMWYDADIDAVMERTKDRPIPAGRVRPEEALNLGVSLSLLSVLSMALMVNYVAAALLALTIAYYVFFYTMWLKRRTPQNIVIGGAAGAFPPMIGWAVVTGTVSIESIALFAIIFMWTPPHFWALSLYRAGDYEKVGVPMMPVVAGKRSTRIQILIYTILLTPVALSPWLLGFAGDIYAMVAVGMSVTFIGLAARVLAVGDGDDADKVAGRLFAFSLLYLFSLFLTILLENLGLFAWGT